MKRKLSILYMAVGLILSGCGSSNAGDGYVDHLPEDIKDGVIMQAFNWKYSQVEDNLPTLAEQGFKIIQLSPVQIPKQNGVKWEFFYQPVSFTVAPKSPLGTKEELIHLCSEADKYGINIIVDVVCNHMATTGQLVNGLPEVDPEVATYEPQLYEGQTTYFHQYKESDLGNTCGQTTQRYEWGVLPDLNTGNSYVQERVRSFLKECIDCGVDGFRFDAAKHIETPEDPAFASNFWPATLGEAKTYYHALNGKELFAYGEILDGLGPGRTMMSTYTEYMHITDNGYIQKVSAGSSDSAQTIAQAEYGKNADESDLIIWAESHDSYIDALKNSKPKAYKKLSREWAVLASRKDAHPIYLARPDDNLTVGVIGNYDFELPVFGASNRFHNRFSGAEEDLSYTDTNVFVNERYTSSDSGAVCVNVRAVDGLTREVSFKHLADGKYFDQVTNKELNVKGGKTTIEFHETGVAVLTKSDNSKNPKISISERGGTYVDPVALRVTAENASESYYQLNDGEKVKFRKSVTINIDAPGTIVVRIVATSGEYKAEKVVKFKKIEGVVKDKFCIVNLNPVYVTDYDLCIWSWPTKGSGKWSQDYTFDETNHVVVMNNAKSYGGFLFAVFNKGKKPSTGSTDFGKPIKQSSDIDPKAATYYDASDF